LRQAAGVGDVAVDDPAAGIQAAQHAVLAFLAAN
jgi:hypothetical protein